MKYGSICSGIEAATVAWHSLGWEPVFFSEIEKFPRALLQLHYPDVPLHGDFTTIKEGMYDPIDLLVGGTPCQSFSVAGLRGGMDDERGNLALEYLKLADRFRPRWIVWENVPGVLSSNGGRDFGSFLGGLGELGYGFSYRVLDAQYFGVPQRRKRVFVIGYLGDWRPAAEVLFERESLRGSPPPSQKAKQDVAGTITAGLGRRRGSGIEPETLVSSETSPALRAQANDSHRDDSMAYVGEIPTTHRMRGFGDYALDTIASALKSRDYKDATDLVCVPDTQEPSHQYRSAVRRLTPIECERLQGFEDAYTAIPWRNKSADKCPDGPRYKALGNSMAVPCMHWLGQRIEMVDQFLKQVKAA